MIRDFKASSLGVVANIVESQEMAIDYRTVSPFKFLTDAFLGTGGFGSVDESYLTPDTTEQFFKTRVKLSVYNNELQRAILALFSRVYTDKPVDYSGTKSPTILAMIDNIDGRGSSVNDLKKYTTQYSLLHGTAFLASGNSGEYGGTPWVVCYTALQYQPQLSIIDNTGNVEMYVFRSGNVYDTYTATKFIRYSDDNESDYTTGVQFSNMVVIEENDLHGQIVSPVRSIPAYGLGVTPIPTQTLSITKLLLGIYEMESRLIQLFTKQLFSRLIVRGDIEAIPEGVTNAIQVESDGSVDLLSPDPAVAGKYLDRIQQLYTQLYEHLRDMGVITVSTNSSLESGVAKSYTFLPVTAAHLRGIAIASDIDRYIEFSAEYWMGKNEKIVVKYNYDYTPQVPLDALGLREIWSVVSESNSKMLRDTVFVRALDLLGVDNGSDEYEKTTADILASMDEIFE